MICTSLNSTSRPPEIKGGWRTLTEAETQEIGIPLSWVHWVHGNGGKFLKPN